MEHKKNGIVVEAKSIVAFKRLKRAHGRSKTLVDKLVKIIVNLKND